MIYISHLVLDDDMKALVKEYGTGIEALIFPFRITWISFRIQSKRTGRR